MAGHAQLKFVMTECSKTQIRLTGLSIVKLGFSMIYIISACHEFVGPVVQSIVSLTKSLVNDSLSLLVRLKSSVLIYFAEKM